MADVPNHYKSRGITHWSPSKLNTPFWLVLAEYAYRLPRFFEARRDQRAGDPEADLRVQHYTKIGSFKMNAGGTVGEKAMQVVNGALTENEAVADAISTLQAYKPANKIDHALTDHLLSSDAEAVSKTLENAVSGLREIFSGANQVNTEEKVLIELPGVDVPSLGYCDGRGGGVIVELKTRWDKANNKSKSGYSNNSVPAAPIDRDVLQIAHYQRQFGGKAKLLYANRINHRIFEVPQADLNEALAKAAAEARRRQRMLERTDTVESIMTLCEPEWFHFMLSNYSPEFILELKQAFYGA